MKYIDILFIKLLFFFVTQNTVKTSYNDNNNMYFKKNVLFVFSIYLNIIIHK
jgi:hypothetical protein